MPYQILGPLEVLDEGPVVVRGRRVRALLAILLLNTNRVVPSSRLIELLWGEDAPDSADHALHVHVASLRKVLPDGPNVLLTRPTGYELLIRAGELDRDNFEAKVAEGQRLLAERNWDTAALRLKEALALWRGPALADFANQAFAIPEATRLDELRLIAVEARLDAELAMGRHIELIGELEALVAAHPLRERLRGQLMLALYRAGRQAEASAVYQDTRRLLVEESGMEPSAALQKLLKDILDQDPSLDVPPDAKEAPTDRSNLPNSLTTFVGREREGSEVRQLLSRSRLVTIWGAGGIGKTRLAIETARGLVSDYRDGVYLVELGGQSDPQLVPQTVALALNVHGHEGRGLGASLVSQLASRSMLLLLDNCEHLVEAVANLVEQLLRSCPRLTVLATSRERLRVEGEVIYHLGGLAVPTFLEAREGLPDLLDYGAIRLFCERAAQVLPTFQPNAADLRRLTDISRRLDGIPLALELAAANLTVLSVEQLLNRLDDRFRVLTSGRRTALPRQQTLKATVDWSYSLLSESERTLLRRLAVFPGRFTLECVEMVCALPPITPDAVLSLIMALADRSLVVVEPREAAAGYRLLETIREYAVEQLGAAGEESLVRDRHTEWYSGLADLALKDIETGRQSWVSRLSDDYENLHAALEWALPSGGHRVITLARALAQLWVSRGYVVDGQAGLMAALHSSDEITIERAHALKDAGLLAQNQGDYRAAYELLKESVRLYEELHEMKTAALTMLPLGVCALAVPEQVPDEEVFLRTVELFRSLGDRWGLALGLNNLAMRGHLLGDRTQRPKRLLEEALIYAGEAGDDRLLHTTLDSLGQVHFDQGNLPGAREAWSRCLVGGLQSHQPERIADALIGFGRLAGAAHAYARSLRLLAVAARLRAELGIIPHPLEFTRAQLARAEAERHLGPAEADLAWGEGEQLTSEQAAQYAMREPEPLMSSDRQRRWSAI